MIDEIRELLEGMRFKETACARAGIGSEGLRGYCEAHPGVARRVEDAYAVGNIDGVILARAIDGREEKIDTKYANRPSSTR